MAFENYEISNLGNCKKGNKLIEGSINNRGYKYIQLQRNGKRLNLLFHHLVAKCFLGERPEKLVIDHIDQNKLNNTYTNLRYVTQKENLHNTKKYRNDILETDLLKRKHILEKESRIRSGKNRGLRREKGTGSIQKRESGTYRATMTINGIKHYGKFKTKEEAEKFLNNII